MVALHYFEKGEAETPKVAAEEPILLPPLPDFIELVPPKPRKPKVQPNPIFDSDSAQEDLVPSIVDDVQPEQQLESPTKILDEPDLMPHVEVLVQVDENIETEGKIGVESPTVVEINQPEHMKPRIVKRGRRPKLETINNDLDNTVVVLPATTKPVEPSVSLHVFLSILLCFGFKIQPNLPYRQPI